MLKEFLSLFLKSHCPLCSRDTDDYLCGYCTTEVLECQLSNCGEFWQGDLPLFVWGFYQGKLKRAIAEMKYNRQPQLGDLMGCWLAKAWLNFSIVSERKKIALVPIPLHSNKLKARGFNQAELIALGFASVTGDRVFRDALTRVRDTKAMFGLNAQQRQQNLQQAFTIGKKLPNLPVLIIDDIYTTGTTGKEAAKVLTEGGIEVIGVGAVAKTKR